MKKSILMLGIGEIGLNQISWAKNTGFTTIVTDRMSNAPSFKFADKSIISDAGDVTKIISELIDNYRDCNLSAVYTGNDFGIVSASIISKVFNIPACPVISAISSIDKSLMKTKWNGDGIQTPLGNLVSPKDDISKLREQITVPCIIKPTSSSGSQGVSIVKSKSEFEASFNEAAKYSSGNHLLIEELIEGKHIDANGIFWKNRFYPCGTSRRYFSDPPYTVPISGHEPAGIDPLMEIKLFDIFEKAGRSLGIDNSPVKADFIISNDGPKIIELSARFHGDLGLSHNSYYRTRLSPAMIYYETLISGKVPTTKLKLYLNNNRYSAWSLINLKPGTVNNLNESILAAKKKVAVDNIFVDSRRGSTFKELKNNNDVSGFIWASGSDLREIKSKLDDFNTCLQTFVKYE